MTYEVMVMFIGRAENTSIRRCANKTRFQFTIALGFCFSLQKNLEVDQIYVVSLA